MTSSFIRSSKLMLLSAGLQWCSFCARNGETKRTVMSHQLHNSKTNVLSCPILRAHHCEISNATGDFAHTRSYCPRILMMQGSMHSTITALNSTRRKASGKERNAKAITKSLKWGFGQGCFITHQLPTLLLLSTGFYITEELNFNLPFVWKPVERGRRVGSWCVIKQPYPKPHFGDFVMALAFRSLPLAFLCVELRAVMVECTLPCIMRMRGQYEQVCAKSPVALHISQWCAHRMGQLSTLVYELCNWWLITVLLVSPFLAQKEHHWSPADINISLLLLINEDVIYTLWQSSSFLFWDIWC
jgi:hypothetical protein